MGVLVAVRWLVLALCFLSVQGRRTTVRGCKCKMDYRAWNGKRYTGGSCVPGRNGGKAWCETEPWTCKTRLPRGTTADVCAGKAPAKKRAPSKKKVVKKKRSKPAPPRRKKQPSSRRGANRRTGDGECSDPGAWRSTIMNLHNNLRNKHSAGSVCWDYGLESSAQSWANGCQWRHSGNGNGENIAIADSWGTTFGMWAAEANGYPYGAATAPFAKMHFTQLVWKGTRRVGCAVASCGMGRFYVCQYSPPGNFMGQFAENVSGPR